MPKLKMVPTLAAFAAVAAFGTQTAASGTPAAREGAAKHTLTVSINGPTQVKRYSTCDFTVVVSGGTPPYTFNWLGYVDEGQTLTTSFGSIGNQVLWVDVHDSGTETGYASLGINVASSWPPCP